MMEQYIPTEPGLVLVYQDRFDKEDLGFTTVTVKTVLAKGSDLEVTLEKAQAEDLDEDEPDISQEQYLLTPEGAYLLPKRTLLWPYPVANREWVEEHPQAGKIRYHLRLLNSYECRGRKYQRVIELRRVGELGESRSVYDPKLGLIYASYMADGTPGETILVKVRNSKA